MEINIISIDKSEIKQQHNLWRRFGTSTCKMHLSPPPLVALAVVRSKAVVLLLLIRCCLLFPLFCNHLDGEERAGCIALFVVLVPRDCCVALPQDATGLSAICDCGISLSYSLTFFYLF